MSRLPPRCTRTHTPFPSTTLSRSPALTGLWAPLMTALQDRGTTGQDVIVDGGRLGLVGWPETVLAEADLSVMLCRTHLPAIAATRSWAETVQRGQDRKSPSLNSSH